MAIYQRGKSWYYDFVHKGQRYTGSFGQVSRTTAKEELARRKTEVIEGRLNPAKARKSPLFARFMEEEYLPWLHANRKPSSHRRIAMISRLHLIPYFGNKRMSDLLSLDIERYKRARKEAGMKPATVNLELTILKSAFRKARTWGKFVGESPATAVKLLKVANERTRFLTEEEEARVLTVCSPALRRIVCAALLTGFRRQELVTPRPEALDFTHGLISVEACYSKNNEHRSLPMLPRLQEVLRDALAVKGSCPFVFITDAGRPWGLNGFTEAFAQACLRAGLERLGPHVLRHTFGSRLVMSGVDLRTVQDLLGHKDIKMTLRYVHLSSIHKQRAMETLARQFPGSSPANSHDTPLSSPSVNKGKIKAVG